MKKTSENRTGLITSLALSISLSFTVFFFSPVDIFLGNQKDFVANASDVIIPMLAAALISSIILFLIICLISRIKPLYNVIVNLLLGALLSFYIQLLFFNGSMDRIGAALPENNDSSPLNTFNAILMYLIVILPLLLSTLRDEKFRDNRSLGLTKGKMIPYISALIFFMQLAGSVNMMVTNGFAETDKTQYTHYLSFEPATSLSKDENIVVFISDRLDGEWLDDILEEYPEMNSELEGFTYYQNNVSRYNRTFPSVPSMLSNLEYNEEDWSDYLEKVWTGNNLPQELHNNGYKVSLLVDQLTTYNSYSDLQCCDNVRYTESGYKVNYLGKNGVIPTMTLLSLYKLSPNIIKDFFSGFNSDLSNNFIVLSSDIPDRMPRAVGAGSDIAFYNYINKNKLTADTTQKTFNFIHLNGAHDISAELSALYPSYDDSYEPTIYTSARGSFEVIFTYLHQMKKLGVYDNSTIIIIADHGRVAEKTLTSLLIKPRNAAPDELRFDTSAELSNVNFYAGILEYAGIDHSEQGYSYNDIINNDLHPDRYHQTFSDSFIGLGGFNNLYKITGNARDFNNWNVVD